MRQFFLVLGVLVLLTSCARSPERFYFGSYSEAEHLYNKGDYEKAIQKYQEYIDNNPEGNMAVISSYYIAKSRQELGQVDEARMIYEDIVNNHPDVVWANFSKSQLEDLGG